MNNISDPSRHSKSPYPYRKKSREHRKRVGKVGEDLACIYLKKKGFKIIMRNYSKKWGEIDVIATKDAVWHFVEVKTVSYETKHNVSSETNDTFKPEENLHPWKMKRVVRASETYLMENGLDEVGWQIDAITIILDIKNRKSNIKIFENVL